MIRATVLLDETIALKVRQMFDGNLSKGVNALLFEHLFKEKKKNMFGVLKGKGLVAELEKMREEERRADEKHVNRYS